MVRVLRRIQLPIAADLSETSLEQAFIQFITEKVNGKFVASPKMYHLHVSPDAFNRTLTLLAFDVGRSIIPPGVAITPHKDEYLTGEDWYISSPGFDFIVGSWEKSYAC